MILTFSGDLIVLSRLMFRVKIAIFMGSFSGVGQRNVAIAGARAVVDRLQPDLKFGAAGQPAKRTGALWKRLLNRTLTTAPKQTLRVRL
ncbi:MAG: hypothetical protein KZQ95_14455 [Candidatus Thiodiazotropha sp. (ex Epidulcina cf. delphinae)]|nr:hypothetical protein [Candidatus Thiodiazotropha sp. (ex Epidulcina cf. delphinae)]MCU7926712.1 hypothetical protein [Candidatus Thiodiazotropha sp. (ex Dulcina madagascariensis)]